MLLSVKLLKLIFIENVSKKLVYLFALTLKTN